MKHLLVLLACTSLVIARNLPTEAPKSDGIEEQLAEVEAPNEVEEAIPESVAEVEVEAPETEDTAPTPDLDPSTVAEEPKAEELAPSEEVDPSTVAEEPKADELAPSEEVDPDTTLEAPVPVAEGQEDVITQETETPEEVADSSAEAATPEDTGEKEPNPLSRINLGVGQSASNAYGPYGYSRSKVGAASLNIGLQNTYYGSYRPIAQYGQSYGSSQRTGPYAPQTWGHAGAGPYGAYGNGGYRGGYGQTMSNAYNVQKRIPVAPGLALLSNLNTDREKEASTKSEVPAESQVEELSASNTQ